MFLKGCGSRSQAWRFRFLRSLCGHLWNIWVRLDRESSARTDSFTWSQNQGMFGQPGGIRIILLQPWSTLVTTFRRIILLQPWSTLTTTFPKIILLQPWYTLVTTFSQDHFFATVVHLGDHFSQMKLRASTSKAFWSGKLTWVLCR